MRIEFKVQKVTKTAKIPDRAYEGDAGYDLYADEEVTIEPETWGGIRTGITIAIPFGYVGLIWEKSGVSTKNGLRTMAGVIDAGFRGELSVWLMNHTEKPFTFRNGDKVAQILFQRIEEVDLVEVDKLDETERGGRGFGSSGK